MTWLQDRLYEIDRSWQNNLVFYGIKPDHIVQNGGAVQSNGGNRFAYCQTYNSFSLEQWSSKSSKHPAPIKHERFRKW